MTSIFVPLRPIYTIFKHVKRYKQTLHKICRGEIRESWTMNIESNTIRLHLPPASSHTLFKPIVLILVITVTAPRHQNSRSNTYTKCFNQQCEDDATLTLKLNLSSRAWLIKFITIVKCSRGRMLRWVSAPANNADRRCSTHTLTFRDRVDSATRWQAIGEERRARSSDQ